MIDVRRLRSESEVVRARLAVRGDADVDGLLDRVLALDVRRREILGEVEVLKQRRNEASREIGDRKRSGESAADLMAEMKAVAERVRELDGELGSVEDDLGTCLAQIPNLPDERVPPGGEGDFVVIRSVGEPRLQTPADEPHWEGRR